MKILDTALLAHSLGLSFLPIRADGSKAPATKTWARYMSERPTREEVDDWFADTHLGIALIGGQVSGGLVCMDFDHNSQETFNNFLTACHKAGISEIIHKVQDGYWEGTPKPGIHLLWRCPENPLPSRKLAMRPGDPKPEVLIELKGEGGYFIVAPSGGKVHPTGKSYELYSGSLDRIAILTPDEQYFLVRMAEAFNELEKESAIKVTQAKPVELPDGHKRAGDDFAGRTTWEEILEPAGWTVLRRHPGGKIEWVKPGSTSKTLHATTGANGVDLFHPFTDTTVFEANKSYDKFATYTVLNHAGDFTASARALSEKGYGDPLPEVGKIRFNYHPAPEPVVDEETGEVVGEKINLANFPPDDEGNAQAFMAVRGQDFLWNQALGYLYWNGSYWQTDGAEQELKKQVTAMLIERRHQAVDQGREAVIKATPASAAKVNACIDMLQKELFCSIERFDKHTDLLNVANGVINLRTGELLPHDRELYFTSCGATAYYPDTRSQDWLEFLDRSVGGGQVMLDYLQMAAGYTLQGSTREEILFYLYGPPRSGKGTFTETLQAALGSPMASEVNFETITSKRDGDSSNFDLAPLKAARAVFASESERYQRLSTAKIKHMTGGNMVYCCFKHKEHFNYKPQYKIWLSSNWPVNGDPDDDALWGRVKVIPFPNSNLGTEDKDLKWRMRSQENLEGVLAWAVAGAVKWYALGSRGLETPQAVKEATESQRSDGDAVQEWLEACTFKDATTWTPNAAVYTSYQKWCEVNGVEPKKAKGLAESLKRKGYEVAVLKRTNTGVQKGVQGLRLILD